MESIVPELDAPQIVIAEHQEEYQTVVGVLANNRGYGSAAPAIKGLRSQNTTILAFRPSDEERARIAAGEDLYLSLLTFGGSMQPVLLTVGKVETAALFEIGVK